MSLSLLYKTKKELKSSMLYAETSLFGVDISSKTEGAKTPSEPKLDADVQEAYYIWTKEMANLIESQSGVKMSLSLLYKTKKELKSSIGQPLLYAETSLFGAELKLNNPLPQVVTGANYGAAPHFNNPSSWYANVTVEVVDGVPIIIGVK